MSFPKATNVSPEWSWESFLFEASFTLVAYLITILTSIRLINLLPEVVTAPKVPLWQTILAFALGTILILVTLKFFKKGIFFHILFSLGLFLGIQLVLSLILPFLFSIILAAGLIALRFLYPKVWAQNIVLILGLSGLCVSLGLNISWITAIILIAILSIYDIIAVYKTRHMVKMAQGLISRRVFPALIIPSKISYFNNELRRVKRGKEFMFLGSGDIAFPLLFCVSTISLGWGKAIACAIGGFIGILTSSLIFKLQKKRRALPALPPIALFSILGFLVGFVFF